MENEYSLSNLDLTLDLDKESYRKQLVKYQVAASRLAYQVYKQQRAVVMVFEGWDAGGKGGAIKRLTEHMDPRGYEVHAIGKPTGEDAQRHYLYRFWRRLPEAGQIGIFDRSWYGRVLVEPVEGFATKTEWTRAYREINNFERQIINADGILFKFFLHIDQDEQARRFERRAENRLKRWKLTEEDWRNREKWEAYVKVVEEMLIRTDSALAPWTLVEGNSKWWARVKVLKHCVEVLSRELTFDPFGN